MSTAERLAPSSPTGTVSSASSARAAWPVYLARNVSCAWGLQSSTALRQQREQALLAAAAVRDAQLRMLTYQLNPHFLFNTLNSIRALINEDRQRARDTVTAHAGHLRYALVERPLHTRC